MTDTKPLLATLDEAAQALQVSRRTIQREIDKGTLKARRIGRATRVAWTEIHRYAEQ